MAARELFSELGYEGTTIRAIARRAGVDPALVHYFFVNKERVFEAVVHDATQMLEGLNPVLDGGLDDLAERLLPAYLKLWEGESGDALTAVFRTTLGKDSAEPLMDSVTPEGLVAKLAAVIGGRDARLRASLIASQLLGVAVQRYVLKLDPLSAASMDRVVRRTAPSIQALIAKP
ncbi:TetR family transcriptional regulator [Streptomyces sp. NPDC005322]|uniref:TetR/AcrR family transcriptional regulator n=1 Tax=unclassified Streptomyces TaxID=2593676 RepID=UPI0033AEC1A8